VLVGIGALLLSTLQPALVGPASADPVSPLAVTKTANPSPVTSGGQLTYTIAIRNTGGAKVDTVVMTDQVNGVGTIQSPPGLPQLTITSTQGPCTQGGPNGNVVTCQIGTIPGNGTVTITIRGQVTAANGTSLNNTASVSGTKSAQNFTTNASVQVLVQGTSGGGTAPDLTLNKTGPTSVVTGGNMDYVLTVNNLGNANTANVKVVDTLPAGVGLQASPFETTSLFTCSSGGAPITITCTGGTVNAGQNATIKIHATAPGTAGSITNTAIVDPDQAIAESNELNNASATVNTNVTTAPPVQGLTIAKTDGSPGIPAETWDNGAGPDPVNPGQVLTYKIRVVNTATTRADDVVITDGTQSLEASSIVASQVVANGTVGNTGGCFVNAPQVTCKVRTLNAGGSITITIQGLVVSTAGASIFNSATVTGNIRNQGVQSSASESTTVRPAVDLTITKADSPDPVCVRSWPTTLNPSADHLTNAGGSPAADGDIPAIGLLAQPVCLGGLTYTFVVGNSGMATASNVAIRDQLAPGVIFDSYDTDGGFVCSVNASNVVSCTGGTVPGAETRQIRFRVVAPPNVGTLTNSVTVDPNNAIFEPDEQNNDATTTTDVRTGIDLVVWKSDKKNIDPPGGADPLTEGFDPIATSGTGTYTIIVDNVGTQDSTGIKVVDTLPAGTKFLSVTADQGFTCGHNGAATGGIVTCVGGHLVGTESEFYNPPGAATPTTGHDEFATIKIKFFATSFVQQVGQTMHNEVRVDPDDTINEVNELNNLATDDTVVTTGNDDKGAFNQLTIDKTQVSPASNGDVATNGILVYNLHVENLGTDPVSNVEVQDFLPAGSRFISATDVTVAGPSSAKFFCAHDGSPTGGTVTCIGGDFSGSLNIIPGPPPVPIARDIRIRIFAPNTPQTAVNVGTVDPANLVPEGNEFDNDDQQDTTVSPCVDQADCTAGNAVYELTIVKTQNRSPIARNGLETYTLTVSNLGSDSISGVTVKDFLPAGTRFFDARDTSAPNDPSRFSCSYDGAPTGGTVTCVGGVLDGTNDTLGAGVPASRQIQIRAFMPDTPGTYTNRSVVDPSNAIPEGNEFNNESDVDTVVQNGGANPYIDLTVDKTQTAVLDQDMPGGANTPVRVDTGQGILYTLHVANGGEGDAFNVSVRDVIPAGVTFFSATDTATGAGMFTCTFTAPNIDCVGATIPAGGSRDITIALVAPTGLDQIASNPAAIKQTITNQAFVDPSNAIAEGDEANNNDSIQTIVESQVNLKVLSKEGPSQANQNQEADYVIKVKNEKTWGDGRIAFDAVVVDYLPVGLIPLSVDADVSNMACETEENPVNLVTCVGDIEPDQEITITVHVFITAASGSLDNEACIDPDHQIDETNELDNCKTKTTEVEPPAAPNLNINKNASKGTVTAGETFTYTVTASNVGNATASGTVTVTDTLPTEVTYQNASATNGFTCSQASGTVTCTGSDLAAGQATVVTIEVTVNDGVTSGFTNTASVSGASQTKSASVTTNVGGAAVDLVLSDITDSPDPAHVGQNVDYTFTVTNAGTNDSGAFEISADMDSVTGLTFVGASASQGFICADLVGTTVTCSGTLPASQSTNVKITFQVTAGSPSTHTLTVKADSGDAVTESSEANNQQTETTTITGSLCTSCVDLVIGGILDTPDPVTDGQSLKFVVTASNAGDIATTGNGPVELLFNLPVGVDYVSATATAGFTCTHTDFFNLGVFEWVICSGDLLAGQGVVATITTTANDAEKDANLGNGTQTLSSSAFVDSPDLFPEGSGADHEFTNANNGYVYENTTFQE
jgi:uncharacterized repeat protein (TIGR01451 family)